MLEDAKVNIFWETLAAWLVNQVMHHTFVIKDTLCTSFQCNNKCDLLRFDDASSRRQKASKSTSLYANAS